MDLFHAQPGVSQREIETGLQGVAPIKEISAYDRERSESERIRQAVLKFLESCAGIPFDTMSQMARDASSYAKCSKCVASNWLDTWTGAFSDWKIAKDRTNEKFIIQRREKA